MRGACNLEVHFHEQDVASVFLENSGTNEDAQFLEVLLVALYACRQLANLGPGPVSASLASALVAAPDLMAAAADHEGIETQGGIARLISYPGTPGRKSFYARMELHRGQVQFNLWMKGFGWFGQGVDYYSPMSVLVLLTYMARKNRTDRLHLKRLANAALGCGLQAQKTPIPVSSQVAIAIEAARSAWEDTVDEADPNGEDLPPEVTAALVWFAPRHLYDQDAKPLRMVFFEHDLEMNRILNRHFGAALDMQEADLPKPCRVFVATNPRDGYVPRYFPDEDPDLMLTTLKHGAVAHNLTAVADFLRQLDEKLPKIERYADFRSHFATHYLFSGEAYVRALGYVAAHGDTLFADSETYHRNMMECYLGPFGRGEERFESLRKMGLPVSLLTAADAEQILTEVLYGPVDFMKYIT